MSNSSMATISSLINSMIGGAMLTLPILFRSSGIGYGLIVLLVSGLISYKTCELYVVHMAQADSSIESTINRLLGAKWERLFKQITGVYLVCLNAIYIDLIIDQCYNIIYFICKAAGHADWVADKTVDHLVFDKFSVQYLSILMLLPILWMTFIRDFSFLLKLTSLGALAVVLYLMFIIYEFSDSAAHIKWKDLPIFGNDLGNLFGTCAIAFTIHTVVNPIIKANADQSKNLRDLRISYLLGFFIYASIGVLGCFTVLGRNCKVTIVNCYLDSWQALSVEIVYFLMLLTVYPCFIEVGRTRLLECYFNPVAPKQYRLFNIGFVIMSCLFAFLGPYAPLDLIMNLVGSIFCFFFVYLMPIKFHWQCLYKLGRDTGSLLSSNEDNTEECGHGPEKIDEASKPLRTTLYSLIMLTGIAIAIYGIFGFFQSLFKQ